MDDKKSYICRRCGQPFNVKKHGNICADCRREGNRIWQQAYRLRYPERKKASYYKWGKTKQCADCGAPIWKVATYCKKCAVKGPRSIRWRGGRHVNSQGYMLIYHKEPHPRQVKGSYVPEHILVWERAEGKPIPEGWHVHHLNGIKTDNRPENLFACPNNLHGKLPVRQILQKRILQLETRIRELEQLHLILPK